MTLNIDLDLVKSHVKNYFKELIKLKEIVESGLEEDEAARLVSTYQTHILQEYIQYFGTTFTLKDVKNDFTGLLNKKIKVSDEDELYLDDFLKRDFSVYWLCLKYLTLGDLYFLIAKRKEGKSDFLNYLIKCVTFTGEFLGYPCKTGKVLAVWAEESNMSLKIKASGHGFDNDDVLEEITTNKSVRILRHLNLVTGINYLESVIKEYKPVLVVIDTARAVMLNSQLNENQAEWASPFYSLQFLAIRYNCTVIVTHHLNKQGDAAGTSALLGIGAGYFKLESNKTTKETILDFTTRDFGNKKYFTKRNRKENGVTYDLINEEGVSEELEELQGKVLRYLLNNKGNIPKSRLKTEFKEPELDSAINNLLEVCLIQYKYVKDDVQYFIPEDNKKLLKRIEKYRTMEEDIELSNQIVNAKSDEEIKELFKDKTVDYKRKIWGLLPDSEKYRVLLVWKNPKFNNKTVIFEDKIYNAEVTNYFYNKDKKSYGYIYNLIDIESKENLIQNVNEEQLKFEADS